MKQKTISEQELKNIIKDKIVETLMNRKNNTAYDMLSNAYENILKISKSNFIPFASPSPSSTEVKVKKHILSALEHLYWALNFSEDLGYGSQEKPRTMPVMENFLEENELTLENDGENDERESDMKSEKGEDKHRRGQVEGYFSNPGVDVAQYAYRLYGIEPKKGEDTNDMKNARSKFMKCLNHETNEAGYPYSFTTAEVNRLYSIISNNQLNENINRSVSRAFNKVFKK